jgi:hypothetical protein
MNRKHALILLGIATVAFTVILELIDPSHVSHGPTILDFEFAGSQWRAAQIVAEWGAKGRSAAHLSLVLDYGYMVSYGLFFCLAGFAIRDTARTRGWPRLAAAGVVVVSGPATGTVRVSFTGTLHGWIVASCAKTVALRHGR